jgi:hypothetical protein
MKPISGPIARSTVPRPAVTVVIRAYVARISGAETMIAAPIPELVIKEGERITPMMINKNSTEIGISR